MICFINEPQGQSTLGKVKVWHCVKSLLFLQRSLDGTRLCLVLLQKEGLPFNKLLRSVLSQKKHPTKTPFNSLIHTMMKRFFCLLRIPHNSVESNSSITWVIQRPELNWKRTRRTNFAVEFYHQKPDIP